MYWQPSPPPGMCGGSPAASMGTASISLGSPSSMSLGFSPGFQSCAHAGGICSPQQPPPFAFLQQDTPQQRSPMLRHRSPQPMPWNLTSDEAPQIPSLFSGGQRSPMLPRHGSPPPWAHHGATTAAAAAAAAVGDEVGLIQPPLLSLAAAAAAGDPRHIRPPSSASASVSATASDMRKPTSPTGIPEWGSRVSTTSTSASGPSLKDTDPDDDPNRLPTFVKVRGLPAEYDPRITKRPKPKKRAPGVCCT
mmetsp:Transcript_35599/g.70377  ORF Transcript_35599/g.70377 Transcript_35599/m.70377 type:complete len:249 (+) Transcript_35599:91-837(+)